MTGILSYENLVFGGSLQQAVEWCVTDAIRENTAEAWRTAADQLRGVRRLVMCMPDGNGDPFQWTLLRLEANVELAERMAGSADERSRWAAWQALSAV